MTDIGKITWLLQLAFQPIINPITFYATLYWENADLDFHILSVDNTCHVYWANTQCTYDSGTATLHNDDTSGGLGERVTFSGNFATNPMPTLIFVRSYSGSVSILAYFDSDNFVSIKQLMNSCCFKFDPNVTVTILFQRCRLRLWSRIFALRRRWKFGF